jgi:hypothetical protein
MGVVNSVVETVATQGALGPTKGRSPREYRPENQVSRQGSKAPGLVCRLSASRQRLLSSPQFFFTFEVDASALSERRHGVVS